MSGLCGITGRGTCRVLEFEDAFATLVEKLAAHGDEAELTACDLDRRLARTVVLPLKMSPASTGLFHRTWSTPGAPCEVESSRKASHSMRMNIAQVCQPEAASPPRMLALPAASSRCIGCASNSCANSMISAASPASCRGRARRPRRNPHRPRSFHGQVFTFFPVMVWNPVQDCTIATDRLPDAGGAQFGQVISGAPGHHAQRNRSSKPLQPAAAAEIPEGRIAESTIRPRRKDSQVPVQFGHDIEIHAVDRGDQRRRQEDDRGDGEDLDDGVLLDMIMPSVASSRKLIFCDRKVAWSASDNTSRDKRLDAGAHVLVFLVWVEA